MLITFVFMVKLILIIISLLTCCGGISECIYGSYNNKLHLYVRVRVHVRVHVSRHFHCLFLEARIRSEIKPRPQGNKRRRTTPGGHDPRLAVDR